jgi:hypothetical protein
MKKLLVSALIVLAVLLTACRSSSAVTPTSSSSDGLPIETQLAVGTLKLERSEQGITVEQAGELLVYWQVYKEISQSGTAAQAEIDGLIAQIEETMTAEQLQSITDMAITQQDVFASMQGVTVASDSGESTINVPSGSAGAGMPAGGPPAGGGGAPLDGGGIPADMGGMAAASGMDQSQSTGAGAGRAGVPSALVEAVIQSLQQKIAA